MYPIAKSQASTATRKLLFRLGNASIGWDVIFSFKSLKAVSHLLSPGRTRGSENRPPAQSVETWPIGVRLVCRELRPVSLEERILVIERVGCGRHATHYFGLNYN